MQSALDCVIASWARVIACKEDMYRPRYEAEVRALAKFDPVELKAAAKKYLDHLSCHYSTNKTDAEGRDRRESELDCLRYFLRHGEFPRLKSGLENYLSETRGLPLRLVDLIRFTLWKDGAPAGAPPPPVS